MSNKPEDATIILPLPNPVLSPNVMTGSIGGRMMKAAASKKLRRLSKEACEALQLDSLPWGRVAVDPKYYHAQKRRRDQDNAMAMLKAVYDGIVDAGIVRDDTPEYMERKQPNFFIDKSAPRITIYLQRTE